MLRAAASAGAVRVALTWLLALGPAAVATAPAPAAPPPTRRDDVREVLHGVPIVDPYRWLEDGRSGETRAWIDAQNRYTHALLDARPGREAIRERLAALSRYDVQSAPQRRGGRYFVEKRRASDDLSILYVREGRDGRDEVLLDPHPLTPRRAARPGSGSATTRWGRQRARTGRSSAAAMDPANGSAPRSRTAAGTCS